MKRLLPVVMITAAIAFLAGQRLGPRIRQRTLEDAKAQNDLGLRWYHAAIDAQRQYGMNSYAATQDFEEAAKLYRIAADQGLADAQNNLGVLYTYGVGVQPDPKEAARWYRKAAEQGQPNAQFNLAAAYAAGRGVPLNASEEARWFRMAAEQGYAPAQAGLGSLYNGGRGVPRDQVEAYKWLSLSVPKLASQNQYREEYTKILAEVTAKLTPEQLAEGDRLVREWKPREAVPTSPDGVSELEPPQH